MKTKLKLVAVLAILALTPAVAPATTFVINNGPVAPKGIIWVPVIPPICPWFPITIKYPYLY